MIAREVQSGVWEGQAIRTARKAGRCQYWLGGEKGRCPVIINVGDKYFDGEGDDWKAGGFATERYCLAHLAPEEYTIASKP